MPTESRRAHGPGPPGDQEFQASGSGGLLSAKGKGKPGSDSVLSTANGLLLNFTWGKKSGKSTHLEVEYDL